jgi:hypothetical protein
MPPTLKDFIRRSEVVLIYRRFLRKSNEIQDLELRRTIQFEISSAFRRNRISTVSAVQLYLSEARSSLKLLEALVSNQGNSDSKQGNNNDVEDQHYRVGQEWPWESKL